GRDEHDRHRGDGAELAAPVEAVVPGEVHVQEHEVGGDGDELALEVVEAARRDGLVAVAGQVRGERRRPLRLVLDDVDPAHPARETNADGPRAPSPTLPVRRRRAAPAAPTAQPPTLPVTT